MYWLVVNLDTDKNPFGSMVILSPMDLVRYLQKDFYNQNGTFYDNYFVDERRHYVTKNNMDTVEIVFLFGNFNGYKQSWVFPMVTTVKECKHRMLKDNWPENVVASSSIKKLRFLYSGKELQDTQVLNTLNISTDLPPHFHLGIT